MIPRDEATVRLVLANAFEAADDCFDTAIRMGVPADLAYFPVANGAAALHAEIARQYKVAESLGGVAVDAYKQLLVLEANHAMTAIAAGLLFFRTGPFPTNLIGSLRRAGGAIHTDDGDFAIRRVKGIIGGRGL